MNASDPIHAEPRSFRVPPAALGALLTSLFLSLHEFVFWTVAAAYQGYIANKSAHASEKSADAAKLAADTAAATLKHVTANDSATSAAALAAFKEEERAYISTTVVNQSSAPILTDPKGQKHYCLDVHFVNGGKTPAIGTWATREATFGPNAERIIKELKTPSFPPSVANMDGPGSDKWASGCTDSIEDATADLLQQNKIDTYIYGVIQYRDIFGDSHETGFCWVRHAGFSPFGGCEYGNWFDKRPSYVAPQKL
jgi:hypothetical protein